MNSKTKEIDYYKFSSQQILNNKIIKVNLVEDETEIYNDIAKIMVNKLKENNEKNIITSFMLPVGPRGQYSKFAKICNLERVNCEKLITINMDEYLDEQNNLIPESHPLSFRRFMRENLFELLDDDLKVKPENIYFPDPANINGIKKIIEELNGVDICFGGVGINGHIAFNEPISENTISSNEFRHSETRILNITRDTILITSLKYGGHSEIVPKRCITIGINEIFMAKKLRFYLDHDYQAAVLRKIIFWKLSPEFPATFIREHSDCSITFSKNVLNSYVNEFNINGRI